MKLLIVGISGSLGSQLKLKVAPLLASVDELISASHSLDFHVSRDLHTLALDITCLEHLKRLFDLHPDITDIIFTPELRHIFSLLDFIRSNSFSPRIICFSSQAVFTSIPYSKNREWRVLAEKLVHNYPLNIIILRLNMVFGHAADRNISLMQRSLKMWPVIPLVVSNRFESAIISPVFIDDLISCLFNILHSTLSPGIYNVSGFTEMSTLSFIMLSSRLNRHQIILIPLPIFLFRLLIIPLYLFNTSYFLRLFEFSSRFIEDKCLATSTILLRHRLYQPSSYIKTLVTSFIRST